GATRARAPQPRGLNRRPSVIIIGRMINNRTGVAGPVFLALSAACVAPDPAASSLQGVVEYEERDLAFEVTGRLAEVAVHEGDLLPAGALVARIVPDIERSALTARESEARVVE